MTPEQAVRELYDLDLIRELPFGKFRIGTPASRSGRPMTAHLDKRDLDTMVLAIKTLGAWSVNTGQGDPPVRVETGDWPDELVFSTRFSR